MRASDLFLLFAATILLHGCTQVSEEHYPSGKVRARVEVNAQGLAHGKGTYYYESGVVSSEGEFVNGLKSGQWNWFDPRGRVLKMGSYADGVESGVFKDYYPDGTTYQVVTYREGKMNGVYRLYRPNGSVESVVTYRDGLQQDTSWFYYPNGSLSMLSIARNDTILQYTKYDSSGRRTKEFMLFLDSIHIIDPVATSTRTPNESLGTH